MIYTITFNPSLDYIIKLKDFSLGKTNRTEEEFLNVGGKGINVSIVLRNMNCESIAFGFISGFTGDIIKNKCNELGLKNKLIECKSGMSRINVKILENKETEINGQGPLISKDELKQLYKQLDDLKNDDILVLSGSVPKNIEETIYKDILLYLKEKNIITVVDAEKNLLINSLMAKPFLIKPNIND